MNEKKVYIVRGSEDGNIGVFSNMKKAAIKAAAYIGVENNSKFYSRVVNEINRYDEFEQSENGVIVYIEKFWLNEV